MGSCTAPNRPAVSPRRVALLALSSLLTACSTGADGTPPPPDAARVNAGSPLAAATPIVAVFEGEVERVLPAGGYTYLEIEGDAGARWVAVMGPGLPAGSRARVDAYAIQHDFHSRRLDRDFAELVFGTVVSSPREPSPPVTTRPST